MSQRHGALADNEINQLISGQFIVGDGMSENVSPGSLDLTVSEDIYRAVGLFQPQPGEKIHDLIESTHAVRHLISSPLERDVVYLARIEGNFTIQDNIYGYCNPKSSTGRNDTHVRVLVDGTPRFDSVPAGYEGEIWLAIIPKSFPVKLFKGLGLSQLRLFSADTRFDEVALEREMGKEDSGLLWTPEGKRISYRDIKTTDKDGSLLLSADLTPRRLAVIDGKEIWGVGWEARGSNNIFDFSRKDHPISGYFEPIQLENGYVYLRKGSFYILTTFEFVYVPPYLACEMVPMDERSGDFRSHYAGFIDPGWGFKRREEGGRGRPLTLEVRPFEDMILRPGQAIAKTKFEQVRQIPDQHYDELDTSNYKEQRVALLSKHYGGAHTL